MPGGQTRTSERVAAAFVLSLLAGLPMLSLVGMKGGLSRGMMGGPNGTAQFHHMMGGWMRALQCTSLEGRGL